MGVATDKVLKDLKSAVNGIDTSNLLSDTTGVEIKNAIQAIANAITYGISDIVINNPVDGQVLKYNSTSQKWENANESGGGSSVVPNPTGTPTDTLDTVSIDGTIYDIQGSGGGGGSSSHIYSTTEHVVGIWIDGSDLYEKTINLTGTYQGDSTIDISSYLIGNENIIESVGYLSYVYSGNTYKQPINGYYANLEYRVNKYQLKLSFGSGSSFSMEAYITIRYTKTGGNS